MEQNFIVEKNQTAKAMKSGELEVLSTPYLVAMVENTCLKEIASSLHEEETTVGVKMDINHLQATKVGVNYQIRTTLVKSGQKSFTFSFEAFSNEEKIACGQHVRVRVNKKEFMGKN